MLVKSVPNLLIILLLIILTGRTTVFSIGLPDDFNSAILSNREMNKVIYYFLSSAEKGQTKYTFTNDNIAHYHIMNELIEAGYLYMPDGGGGSETYGDSYIKIDVSGIRITLKGREYLERLRSQQFWPSLWRIVRNGIFWVITIAISAIIAAKATKMINKMSLFKKNNK